MYCGFVETVCRKEASLYANRVFRLLPIIIEIARVPRSGGSIGLYITAPLFKELILMSFTVWQYPLLLLLSTLLYWSVGAARRPMVLLVVSYYFYATWDFRFLVLIVATTVLDYLNGRRLGGHRLGWHLGFTFLPALFFLAWMAWQALHGGDLSGVQNVMVIACSLLIPLPFIFLHLLIDRFQPARWERWIVASSFALNLCILGFFKYFHFFIDSAVDLLGALGLEVHPVTIDIILPVGISFHIFQSLAYVMDVYRRRTPACASLTSYAAYVAFFPQLVAGPIERSHKLLPQITGNHAFEGVWLLKGIQLLVVGYFLKLVVADNCAVVANYAFSLDQSSMTGPWAVLGVLAFAFQIYGDFAGYTMMARGSANFFGVHLSHNFFLPYFARGPSDFWNRWHVTLSTWFRDMVYIPLGGNRRGQGRTMVNLVVTMLLAGLWHGASWMFVLWGLYHGLLLVLYRVVPVLARLENSEQGLWWRAPVSIALMFGWVLVGWALFRSPSMAYFATWCRSLLIWSGVDWWACGGALLWLALHVAPLLVLQAIGFRERDESGFLRYPLPVRVFILLLLTYLVGSSVTNDAEFIYRQF